MFLKSINTVSKIFNNNSKIIYLASNARNFYATPKCDAIVPFNLSDIGEGIREVVVKEWFVKVGDKVSQFDNICEVQSDKASVTITSRYDGIVQKLHYKIDDIALVGNPLIDIETDEDNSNVQHENTITSTEPLLEKTIKEENENILCIPSVRRLAKEHNVNLSLIHGTGKNNRIVKEDILRYLDQKQNQQQTIGQEVKLNKTITNETWEEPLKGFQRTMVKTMTESLKIPHLVYGDEIIITKLSQMRADINKNLGSNDLKISYLPFFIKAISNALKSYPMLNSSLSDNCDKIIYKKQHNVGVAMDTALGLAVPVIKDVQSLTLFEINQQLKNLISSGKKGQFSPNDLSDGTITISNIGSIGGTYMKPVIMPPQICLLAIGSKQIVPKFNEAKQIVAEEIINISAAADHRIIDGATIARFIDSVKTQLQNPLLLFVK